VLLLCPLTILGCSSGKDVQRLELETPRVVDHAHARCPAASEQQRAILRRVVGPPPAGDLAVGTWQRKTDELRLDAANKGRIGLALADELDKCRGDAPEGQQAKAGT
jgi:hypothetical protein